MAIPMSGRREAPGPCGSCNWAPDAAHVNVPGDEWEYVAYVDPGTWLCPACGMPNEAPADAGTGTDPGRVAAPADVPVLDPPPGSADASAAARGDAGAAPPDGLTTTQAAPASLGGEPELVEPAPITLAAPEAGPAPGATAVVASDTAPVLSPPDGGAPPFAPFVADLLDVLSTINDAVQRLRGEVLPALYESDVDPFTLADLLINVGTVNQLLHVTGAEIAGVVAQALAVMSSAAVLPPEFNPEPTNQTEA